MMLAGDTILADPAGSLAAHTAAVVTVGGGSLTPVFRDEMVPALYRAAVRYDIDPAVLIGQSAHETGWGRFGRAVTPEHHNTCGLKVTRPVGPDDNPDDHARFATWDNGATAHAQHLYAYMGKALPAGETNIDPRWIWVYGKHAITTLSELGGKWAPSLDYGRTVAAVAQRILANLEEPQPAPAVIDVDALAEVVAEKVATRLATALQQASASAVVDLLAERLAR